MVKVVSVLVGLLVIAGGVFGWLMVKDKAPSGKKIITASSSVSRAPRTSRAAARSAASDTTAGSVPPSTASKNAAVFCVGRWCDLLTGPRYAATYPPPDRPLHAEPARPSGSLRRFGGRVGSSRRVLPEVCAGSAEALGEQAMASTLLGCAGPRQPRVPTSAATSGHAP